LEQVKSFSIKPRLAERQPSTAVGCSGCRPGRLRSCIRQARVLRNFEWDPETKGH